MLPYAVPIQNQSNNNLNWESKYLLQIDNIQTVPLNHQDSSITTFITKLMLHQSWTYEHSTANIKIMNSQSNSSAAGSLWSLKTKFQSREGNFGIHTTLLSTKRQVWYLWLSPLSKIKSEHHSEYFSLIKLSLFPAERALVGLINNQDCCPQAHCHQGLHPHPPQDPGEFRESL